MATPRAFEHRSLGFAIIAAGYMLAYFHRVAPAAIAGDLQIAFNASGALLGSIAAAYFYTYALMQVPTGILVDTVGVRRVVALGTIAAAAGTLLFAYSESIIVAVAGRVLIGIGVGVMFIALLKFNALWFHERHFATASGVSILVGNIGAIMAGMPLVWGAEYFSWRSIFAFLALMTLLLGVLSWWFLKDAPVAADSEAAAEPWRASLLGVLRNRATWPALWPNVGIGGTLFAFNGLWAVPYLHDVHGLSRSMAALHVSVLIVGFAVGALLVGLISDRLQRRLPILLGVSALYVLAWLPLLLAWKMPLLLSFILFAAMGLGAAGFTLNWACVKEVNHPRLAGMAMSVVNIGAFAAAGILQPLVGWVMDARWDGTMSGGARIYSSENYRAALTIFLLCSAAGWLGSFTIRETRCKNIFSGPE